MAGRPHPRDLKLMVTRQVASGEKRVLRRWRKEYAARGERAFLPRTAIVPPADDRDNEVAELERLCGRLALENARLKRALATTGRDATTGTEPDLNRLDAVMVQPDGIGLTSSDGGAR